jgi:hypothetical protein
MIQYWREVKAGRRERNEKPFDLKPPGYNPLFDLPEKERSKLFVWMRECPYRDAIREMIREKGLPEVTDDQLQQFFQEEAHYQWEFRTSRAADEADALVQLAEKRLPRLSAGMLHALGQTAFRLATTEGADPGTLTRIATLFMRAKGDQRADQMQELKREHLRHELQEQLNHALEKLSQAVEEHPAAREAFEALRSELAGQAEEEA